MYCPNCKIDLAEELKPFHYGDRAKGVPLNYSNEDNTIDDTEYIEIEFEYCPRCGYYEIADWCRTGTIYTLQFQND